MTDHKLSPAQHEIEAKLTRLISQQFNLPEEQLPPAAHLIRSKKLSELQFLDLCIRIDTAFPAIGSGLGQTHSIHFPLEYLTHKLNRQKQLPEAEKTLHEEEVYTIHGMAILIDALQANARREKPEKPEKVVDNLHPWTEQKLEQIKKAIGMG